MHDDTLSTKSSTIPWLLLLVVLVVPLLVWAERLQWRLSSVTVLALFPLLGLWAWGIMWTHYAYGALRLIYEDLQKNLLYSKITGVLVVTLILLHPTLLAWKQWQTQKLLPPSSFYGYADSSLKVFVLMGTLALLTFLSFEVFNRMKKRPWVQRHWHLVSLSQMLAMTFIFLHGIALGQSLNNSWLEFYWVILGALLIPCFGLIGRADWQQKTVTKK